MDQRNIKAEDGQEGAPGMNLNLTTLKYQVMQDVRGKHRGIGRGWLGNKRYRDGVVPRG